MNKVSIIIQREYITRVRKKSFIIMTLLAPALLALMSIVPALVMSNNDKDFKKIAVVEEGSDLFKNVIADTRDADFVYLDKVDINDIRDNFEQAGYYGILYILPELVSTPNAIQLISKKQPPIGLLLHISGSLEREINKQKLLSYNIENIDEILKNMNTKVSIQTIKIDESGNSTRTSTPVSMALAYIGGFLIYMLIFIFGSQVMRGVIEEKTSRVVEVVVSSVKPVQLMMGKIFGIALVGLTQFLVWVILTFGIISVVQVTLLNRKDLPEMTQDNPASIMSENKPADQAPRLESISRGNNEIPNFLMNFINQDWLKLISLFLFYFITGYLLYASIFAAIGSAVDNETETQQFMLPVTIPIILGLMVAMGTMQNPESSLSFWFSIIPFTSPIVMIARIPFEVPAWQVILSMTLIILTLAAFIIMAAKIYRAGILMYGKKSSWKEIWKWLKYRE
jgi:ABC-2 type transport system permease protein